jgi:hypothetical protein
MPGQLGNFAVAGHRSGYGEPLSDIDKLQPGDKIIFRTADYWYVYTYKEYKLIDPNDTGVVAAIPFSQTNGQNPAGIASSSTAGQDPTERFITLTTCDPKYSTPIHRWAAWGTFDYWAKTTDGIPQELASKDSSGAIQFTANDTASESFAAKVIPDLTQLLLWLVIAYVIIYIASLIVWRYPGTKRKRSSAFSIYGWIFRHHPGVVAVRWIQVILLVLIALVLLFQWGYPWLATNVPYLQVSSNFVSVN